MEDRSKWRYEQGGPALEAAIHLVNLLKALTVERLKGDDISSRFDEVRALVTEDSWTVWHDDIKAGFDIPWLNQFTGHSKTVRFPADGMAYVVWPITHPDQDEDYTIDKPQLIEAHIATLLEERGRWRVHRLGGGPIPPQELGLEPLLLVAEPISDQWQN